MYNFGWLACWLVHGYGNVHWGVTALPDHMGVHYHMDYGQGVETGRTKEVKVWKETYEGYETGKKDVQ